MILAYIDGGSAQQREQAPQRGRWIAMPHDVGAVVREFLRQRMLAQAAGRTQGLQDGLRHHGKSGTGCDAGDHHTAIRHLAA